MIDREHGVADPVQDLIGVRAGGAQRLHRALLVPEVAVGDDVTGDLTTRPAGGEPRDVDDQARTVAAADGDLSSPPALRADGSVNDGAPLVVEGRLEQASDRPSHRRRRTPPVQARRAVAPPRDPPLRVQVDHGKPGVRHHGRQIRQLALAAQLARDIALDEDRGDDRAGSVADRRRAAAQAVASVARRQPEALLVTDDLADPERAHHRQLPALVALPVRMKPHGARAEIYPVLALCHAGRDSSVREQNPAGWIDERDGVAGLGQEDPKPRPADVVVPQGGHRFHPSGR